MSLRRAESRRALTTPAPAHVCPVCGGANDCAPARTGDFATPCWCSTVVPDPGALAALPPGDRGRACLCRRCLTGRRPDPAPGSG